MEECPDFLGFFEKRLEIKLKKTKNFSTESKEQRQNLKRTEIIAYLRGVTPPKYLSIYAKF